jgi:hypothetical protein
LNALYLARLGYGEYHRGLSAEAIAGFLDAAPRYAEGLKTYPYRNDRNQSILNALDELIARIERQGRLVSRGAEPEER